MAKKFHAMSRLALRALSPGEAIREHGIVAERMRGGDLRFAINIMVDGERIHRVIGRASERVTREQAEQAIEALRTRAREGRLDLPQGRKVHRTFSEAAEEYLQQIEHDPKHGRNLGPKRRHIRQQLAPYFKGQRPDKLTDFAISHYIKHRRDGGAAVATINRELSTLSHFLNRAVEWKWMRADQRPKISKGVEPRKQIVVLSATDQLALMQAAVGDHDPLTWLFVAIAMSTGMRHSEILRIEWANIDFSNRRIYVGKAKSGQREQPIPESLAAILTKEHIQLGNPDGYLFPTTSANAKHPHRQGMSGQFRRTVERARLNPKNVTPHVLRHTAITGLVQAGVDLPTIQRFSGHKTLSMVMRYTHLSDDHIDKAVAKLDTAFCDAITPELHTPVAPAKSRSGMI